MKDKTLHRAVVTLVVLILAGIIFLMRVGINAGVVKDQADRQCLIHCLKTGYDEGHSTDYELTPKLCRCFKLVTRP